MQTSQVSLALQDAAFVRAGRDSEHRPGEVKLHVCNLPYSTSHWQIGALFAVYGEVLEAFVFKRPNMQNGSRSAIVRMATPEAATAAAAALDQIPWRGCVLRIRRSHYDENVPEAGTPTPLVPQKPRPRRIRRDNRRGKTKNAGHLQELDTVSESASNTDFTTRSLTSDSVLLGLPHSPASATPSTPLSVTLSLTSLSISGSDDGLLERSFSFVHDPYAMSIWGPLC